jgi:YgiT-type zinc finger domain-containing protein
MNCFFCRGEIIDGFTTFTANLGNCVIVIKNVPAKICSQCGEVSFADDVFKRLEDMSNTIRENFSTEIAVVKYSEPKAA